MPLLVAGSHGPPNVRHHYTFSVLGCHGKQHLLQELSLSLYRPSFWTMEPDETQDREDEEGGVAEFVPVEYAAPPLPVSGADTQWERDTAG
ncbi:unnamed protein product [Sphagnum balticum]